VMRSWWVQADLTRQECASIDGSVLTAKCSTSGEGPCNSRAVTAAHARCCCCTLHPTHQLASRLCCMHQPFLLFTAGQEAQGHCVHCAVRRHCGGGQDSIEQGGCLDKHQRQLQRFWAGSRRGRCAVSASRVVKCCRYCP
jgi:hypothetical protein